MDDDMYAFLDADDAQALDADDDEKREAQEFRRRKDMKIYLIDAHAAMNQHGRTDADGRTPLQQALAAVSNVLSDQIITSENDLVGVALYGTEQSKNPNPSAWPHIYILQELDIPDAARIKEQVDETRRTLRAPARTTTLPMGIFWS